MFDVGWSEILVIAVVALVAIGPKDLPRVLFEIGRWVGKARAFTGELQRGLAEMARQAELDEMRRQAAAVEQEMAAHRAEFSQEIRQSLWDPTEMGNAASVADEKEAAHASEYPGSPPDGDDGRASSDAPCVAEELEDFDAAHALSPSSVSSTPTPSVSAVQG
ncbi:Sec-independent protein translocase protein TatB [Azospirillaceae bacterium]